jgi:hypothetical protein
MIHKEENKRKLLQGLVEHLHKALGSIPSTEGKKGKEEGGGGMGRGIEGGKETRSSLVGRVEVLQP